MNRHDTRLLILLNTTTSLGMSRGLRQVEILVHNKFHIIFARKELTSVNTHVHPVLTPPIPQVPVNFFGLKKQPHILIHVICFSHSIFVFVLFNQTGNVIVENWNKSRLSRRFIVKGKHSPQSRRQLKYNTHPDWSTQLIKAGIFDWPIQFGK